jgi:hypothetical protein
MHSLDSLPCYQGFCMMYTAISDRRRKFVVSEADKLPLEYRMRLSPGKFNRYRLSEILLLQDTSKACKYCFYPSMFICHFPHMRRFEVT